MAIDPENGLIGSPEIKCNPDTIEMAFRTRKMFRGKVFVKGHYSSADCRVEYWKSSPDGNPIGGIKLTHGQCDMDRQRMLFITKIDRAFHIKCMYREAARSVSSGIEVSAIPTQSIEYDFPTPTCVYSIRQDEIDGPILKYARVGDQIVHRWECQSDVYGLLVHTCYVEDGQGDKELIIDEKGCHTDRTLLGDPTYVESLNMAYRESLVFKFADRVIVRFQCEIKLCVKDSGGCAGITPPLCYENPQGQQSDSSTILMDEIDLGNLTAARAPNYTETTNRRLARSSNHSAMRKIIDTDLFSQPVYVLDTDEDQKTDSNALLRRTRSGKVEICMSTVVFWSLLSFMIALLLALTASIISAVLRWYRSKSWVTSGGACNKSSPFESGAFGKCF